VEQETAKGSTPDSSDENFVNHIAKINVIKTMDKIRANSNKLNELIENGQVKLIGGFYDVSTGRISFFEKAPKKPL